MPNTSKNTKKPSPKPAFYILGALVLALAILGAALASGTGTVTPAPAVLPPVQGETTASPAVTPAVVTEDYVIPVAGITETAIFYPIVVDGVEMELFAVKAPDGTIRTAFNTCQVCYDSGRGYYVQEGDTLVCQNCGNRFKTSDVEKVRGGCNPLPIVEEYKTVDENNITFPYELLQAAKEFFINWKY